MDGAWLVPSPVTGAAGGTGTADGDDANFLGGGQVRGSVEGQVASAWRQDVERPHEATPDLKGELADGFLAADVP